MNEETIMTSIRNAIRMVTNDQNLEITRDTEFVDELNFTSIMFFMMITTVENEIDFFIPERLLRKMDTIGDLVDAILEQTK